MSSAESVEFDHGVLAHAIRAYRKRESVTLDQLATRSGVSRSMICQIESEKTIPSIAVVWKLAEAMHTTVGVLLGENEQSCGKKLSNFKELLNASDKQKTCDLFEVSSGCKAAGQKVYFFAFHSTGVQDFESYSCGSTGSLIVTRGEVIFSSGDTPVANRAGDVMEFKASCPFQLEQSGKRLSEGFLVISQS